MNGPYLTTAIAERAPTLTLPRKREREWTDFEATIFGLDRSVLDNAGRPSIQGSALPLPLAGEGWGGGVSADPDIGDWHSTVGAAS